MSQSNMFMHFFLLKKSKAALKGFINHNMEHTGLMDHYCKMYFRQGEAGSQINDETS